MSNYMILSNVDGSMVVVKLIESCIAGITSNLDLEIYRVNKRAFVKSCSGKRIGNLVTRISAKDFVKLSFIELQSNCCDRGTLSRQIYGEIKHWLISNEYADAV